MAAGTARTRAVRFQEHAERGIQEGDQRLSRVEQVTRQAILPSVCQPGNGGDPTLNLRRGQIAKSYARQIEELYA